jgi:hypothetical protein
MAKKKQYGRPPQARNWMEDNTVTVSAARGGQWKVNGVTYATGHAAIGAVADSMKALDKRRTKEQR